MPIAVECKKNIIAVYDTLDIIKGKWRIPIMASLLMRSELLFNELKSEIPTISSKVLSNELRFLEENNIISREVITSPIFKVRYRLTAYGRTLENLIFVLMDWGFTHRQEITGTKSLSVSNHEYIKNLQDHLPPLA